jgi:hypothetical protein
VSHLRLVVLGAVLGSALMVLLDQPWRLQRCATSHGPASCEDRRTWDAPDARHLVLAGMAGALVVVGLGAPFVRRC